MSFYAQLFSQKDLVFDIGAHIGDMTQRFLDEGAKKVVAVEPQEVLTHKLKERFAKESRVIIETCALGKEYDQGGKMYVCAQADTISTLTERWMTGRFKGYKFDKIQKVEIKTLDQLIIKHGVPCYIKIDANGAAREVIMGLNMPVDNISFGFTKESFSDVAWCTLLLDKLATYKYSFTRYNTEEMAGDWTDSKTLIAYLLRVAYLDWGNIYASRR